VVGFVLYESPNNYGAELFSEKSRTSVVLRQSGNHFSGWSSCPKIGYEAKRLWGGVEAFGRTWRPCNFSNVFRIKTETLLGYFGLARWKALGKANPGWYLGMEEIRIDAQWKIGHSVLRLQPQKHLQNKAVLSQPKKRCLFLWLQKIIPILIVAHGDWELMAERVYPLANIFLSAWLTTFLPNQSYEKAIMGVVP